MAQAHYGALGVIGLLPLEIRIMLWKDSGLSNTDLSRVGRCSSHMKSEVADFLHRSLDSANVRVRVEMKRQHEGSFTFTFAIEYKGISTIYAPEESSIILPCLSHVKRLIVKISYAETTPPPKLQNLKPPKDNGEARSEKESESIAEVFRRLPSLEAITLEEVKRDIKTMYLPSKHSVWPNSRCNVATRPVLIALAALERPIRLDWHQTRFPYRPGYAAQRDECILAWFRERLKNKKIGHEMAVIVLRIGGWMNNVMQWSLSYRPESAKEKAIREREARRAEKEGDGDIGPSAGATF